MSFLMLKIISGLLKLANIVKVVTGHSFLSDIPKSTNKKSFAF